MSTVALHLGGSSSTRSHIDAWPRAWVVALLCVLAFAFLGSRGIWDPDEGRYTNVALNMVDSGNWVDLKRNDEVGHWTKPPLTYWTIAASVSVFGRTPWAARLPMALAYLACALFAWQLARRLAPGAENLAALAFATMLLPFGASQLVTTDFVLAAFETAAMWAFVECRMGDGRHSRRWIWLMWAAFGLAFLTKGPPALVPLLVVFAYDVATARDRRASILSPVGLALFAIIAVPWFVVVSNRHPGLLAYFIGDEVVARVASDQFGRHGSWIGWAQVYIPTLVVGTMPWTFVVWRWLRDEARWLRRWRDRTTRSVDAPVLLLLLWILLPLLVFCLARSRLPLYILPLFVPLSLVVARRWLADAGSVPSGGRIIAWCALLVALKLGAAFWPTHKDASDWADAIRSRVPYQVEEVLFVEDMARYGLNMHLGAEIEKIVVDANAGAQFNPEYDESLAEELAEDVPGSVYVAKQERWDALRRRIENGSFRVTAHGTPYEGRVLFSVARCETVMPTGAARCSD